MFERVSLFEKSAHSETLLVLGYNNLARMRISPI